jgi:tetratricopeptide (TPR) repeat protein
MKKLIIIIILLPVICLAQSYKDYLRKGNKLYEQKKYNDAEINYLKSLDKNKNSDKSVFNIGDALYKQEQYSKAAEKFNDLTNRKIDKDTRAMAYHNLGNSLLKDKKYEESIEAYKNSLRNSPEDMETKYNLEYARRMLMQQQQQQKQNQQQQNQNQNQQQQKQQQQQNQDNKENKDKNKQDQQQQQEQNNKQQQQKQQQPKISKQDAQRMLQALANEEKNLQKKLNKQAGSGRVKTTKPW